MRSLLLSLSALLLLLGVASAQDPDDSPAAKKLAEAAQHFSEAHVRALTGYCKDLAEVVAMGDRIEVYLLDGMGLDELSEEKGLAADEFPILPLKRISKIEKRATLSPEQRAELLPALQKALRGASGTDGVLCHYPIHGIRIFSGDKIIFQSSLCWHCHNFGVEYPDGPNFSGFDQGRDDLQKVMEKLMPIPKKDAGEEGK